MKLFLVLGLVAVATAGVPFTNEACEATCSDWHSYDYTVVDGTNAWVNAPTVMCRYGCTMAASYPTLDCGDICTKDGIEEVRTSVVSITPGCSNDISTTESLFDCAIGYASWDPTFGTYSEVTVGTTAVDIAAATSIFATFWDTGDPLEHIYDDLFSGDLTNLAGSIYEQACYAGCVTGGGEGSVPPESSSPAVAATSSTGSSTARLQSLWTPDGVQLSVTAGALDAGQDGVAFNVVCNDDGVVAYDSHEVVYVDVCVSSDTGIDEVTLKYRQAASDAWSDGVEKCECVWPADDTIAVTKTSSPAVCYHVPTCHCGSYVVLFNEEEVAEESTGSNGDSKASAGAKGSKSSNGATYGGAAALLVVGSGASFILGRRSKKSTQAASQDEAAPSVANHNLRPGSKLNI